MKFIYAAFVNIAIFVTIRRYTRYVFAGILLYGLSCYTDFNFEIYRQVIAVAIFLLAYPFVVRRQWHWYFCCVFLAYMMHNSAAILMFVPLFHTFDRTAIAGILALCSIVIFNSAWLGQTIIEFMSSDLFAETSAIFYLSNESDLSLEIIRTYLFQIVFPMAMLIVFRLEKIKINYQDAILLYTVSFVLSQFVWGLTRLSQYFIIFSCMFYVESYIYLARRLTLNYRRVVFSLLMTLSIYFYIGKYYNEIRNSGHLNYERYIPYTSIFDKQEVPGRNDLR